MAAAGVAAGAAAGREPTAVAVIAHMAAAQRVVAPAEGPVAVAVPVRAGLVVHC